MGLHGWLPVFMCFFFFFWVTRPSSLKRQWHNAEDADWNYKLGSCQRKPDMSYSPIHTHTCTKEHHTYIHRRFLSIWFTRYGYILWCVMICVCCVVCWRSVFRSGSRSEEMFGFCLVSATVVGVDYLWVSRWWTGCWSSMMCLWPKGVVACN